MALLFAVNGCGGGDVSSSGGGPSDAGEGGLITAGPCGMDRCICQPGQASCTNGKAKACKADGSGFVEFECDPVQGMTCQSDGCKGRCAETWTTASYIGCDYYPTVTLNPVWSGFDFAVAIANASDAPAHLTITRGSTTVAEEAVSAGGIRIVKLPWVSELKGGDVNACQNPPDPGSTRVVSQGAYRLRADVPVTAYQFSPLAYEISPVPTACPVGTQCPGGLDPACKSFSNDASLLFPVNALTGNYTGLAWPSGSQRAGFLAVTATEDDTDVSVIGRGAFAAGAGIDAAGNGRVKLARGDVLELIADHAVPAKTYGTDISGTLIRASRPVQVIGGHSCANIPTATAGYCDHLEQALFPVEVLGKDYLVTYPAAVASESPHVIRIAAVTADTTITFDPPIAPTTKLAPEDPVLEIADVTKDVRIQADKAILVAQYMQGSTSVPSNTGDPSMSLAIPSAQYRPSYIFVAPLTYDANFVNVIAPKGATVSVDGKPLASSAFVGIGSSDFAVARHALEGGEVHKIAASASVGIVVYGYGKDTSYMYPGGLDLKRITPPPIK